MKLSHLFAVILVLLFLVGSAGIVFKVNKTLKALAFEDAQKKAELILQMNGAIAEFFSKQLQPDIKAMAERLGEDDRFNPVWMSAIYAGRQIGESFKGLTGETYTFRKTTVNARNADSEPNAYERAFITELEKDPGLIRRQLTVEVDGKPCLLSMERAPTLGESCLRCHNTPAQAPPEIIEMYGAERGFGRRLGQASVFSVLIPLEEEFAHADALSLQLSLAIMLMLILILSGYFLMKQRLIFLPLSRLRTQTKRIAGNPGVLGEKIRSPFRP